MIRHHLFLDDSYTMALLCKESGFSLGDSILAHTEANYLECEDHI